MTPAEPGLLKRNVLIHDDYGFVGDWVAIPREDFDAARAALVAAPQPALDVEDVRYLLNSHDSECDYYDGAACTCGFDAAEERASTWLDKQDAAEYERLGGEGT